VFKVATFGLDTSVKMS